MPMSKLVEILGIRWNRKWNALLSEPEFVRHHSLVQRGSIASASDQLTREDVLHSVLLPILSE